MRAIACALAAVVLFSGCANVEYRDTNASVDARPECAGTENAKSGEGIPSWCERSSTVEWSSSDSSEVDFGRKDES